MKSLVNEPRIGEFVVGIKSGGSTTIGRVIDIDTRNIHIKDEWGKIYLVNNKEYLSGKMYRVGGFWVYKY